jgi:hypothetical protein
MHHSLAVVSLVLVGLGVLLILLGASMSLADWKKARASGLQPRNLGDTFSGLAQLLEALKGYPTGVVMIVLGIVILIVAGLFGGITDLRI